MNWESEISVLMNDDNTLMSILEGGVYTSQEIGVEGIRRGDGSPTAQAFDTDGRLLPCAIVRQRDINPVMGINDLEEKMAGITQVIEVHYYQFRGHDLVDAAKERNYFVLIGQRLTKSYPLMFDFETAHIPDVGPVANATTVRQDWRVVGLRRP